MQRHVAVSSRELPTYFPFAANRLPKPALSANQNPRCKYPSDIISRDRARHGLPLSSGKSRFVSAAGSILLCGSYLSFSKKTLGSVSAY